MPLPLAPIGQPLIVKKLLAEEKYRRRFQDLGIAAGAVVSLLPFELPVLVNKTFDSIASLTSPLALEYKKNGIHMDFSFSPVYNSRYIKGINNLYEFDCGEGSGWMYRVNGVFPNYGCSQYQVEDGDTIEWLYTCDLGVDLGRNY